MEEKEIELVQVDHSNTVSSINFKFGDFQTEFTNPIDSYTFWKDAEEQANRAQFRLKKLNPKLSFDFSLQSMMTPADVRKKQVMAHLQKKYPSVDAEKLFAILETNIKEIQPTGPDANHPNPFLKFAIDSDFIKVFVSSIIEAYNK